MAEQFSMDWAREILDKGTAKAQEMINDTPQVEALLDQLQEKMKDLPGTVAGAFVNVPLMAQMVKGYVAGTYTAVSAKTVVSLIGAFLYLVKSRDIIPDYIPVIGLADDLIIATVAMAINEPELRAFKEWRDAGCPAPVAEAEVQAAEIFDVSPIAEA